MAARYETRAALLGSLAAVASTCAVALLYRLAFRAAEPTAPNRTEELPAHILQLAERLTTVDHDVNALLPSPIVITATSANSSTTTHDVRRRRSSSSVLTNFTLPMAVVDMDAFRSNVRHMGLAVLQHNHRHHQQQQQSLLHNVEQDGANTKCHPSDALFLFSQPKQIRLATKSFRCPELIEEAAKILELAVQEELHERLLHDQSKPHQPSPLPPQHHLVAGGRRGSPQRRPLAPPTVGSLEFDAVDELSHDQGQSNSATAAATLVSGVMTFTPTETLFWAKRGSFRSVFLGYPIGDPHAAHVVVEAMLWNPSAVRCSVAVDHVTQLEYLAAAALHAIQKERYVSGDGFDAAGSFMALHVVIDVDMSYRPPGPTALHLGARRSPLRTATDVRALIDAIQGLNVRLHALTQSHKVGLRIVVDGIMGYEAQIASVPDVTCSGASGSSSSASSMWSTCLAKLTTLFKNRSMNDVVQRRMEIATMLRSMCGGEQQQQKSGGSFYHSECLMINGGGSGSLARTLEDPCVTEVTIGSGALCGHLFDGFLQTSRSGETAPFSFLPALFMILSVTRVPGPGFVTCAGGGWIASGPANSTRLPKVIYPGPRQGVQLRPTAMEGFGEVQTPFHVQSITKDAAPVSIGDVVICRPAKSGELAEHFEEYYLVDSVGSLHAASTYRGASLVPWS